jgi:hypothetical protein
MAADEPGDDPGSPEVQLPYAVVVPHPRDDALGNCKGGLLPGAVEGIEEGAAGEDGVGRLLTQSRCEESLHGPPR